jgi:ABC-type Mn2+/Zn2+ transport system permease subunit
MLRWFVAGFTAAVAVALVGGFLVLRSGLIPANADA